MKTSIFLAQFLEMIRGHYGFQSTGTHFLDMTSITQQAEESYYEDNLMTTNRVILVSQLL